MTKFIKAKKVDILIKRQKQRGKIDRKEGRKEYG
jgi:hypothetical protein